VIVLAGDVGGAKTALALFDATERALKAMGDGRRAGWRRHRAADPRAAAMR
jgi:hypothetical protein